MWRRVLMVQAAGKAPPGNGRLRALATETSRLLARACRTCSSERSTPV
jgi:hypothetical protein